MTGVRLQTHTCCIKPTRSCMRNSCEGDPSQKMWVLLFFSQQCDNWEGERWAWALSPARRASSSGTSCVSAAIAGSWAGSRGSERTRSSTCLASKRQSRSQHNTRGFNSTAAVVIVTPVGEVAGVGDVCVHGGTVGLRDWRTCRAQKRHNLISIILKTKPFGKDINNPWWLNKLKHSEFNRLN